MCPSYISKINSNCEKKNSINDSKRRKQRMALSCSKKNYPHCGQSKHDGVFYCLNCLHSFKTGNKLKSHEKACKNKDFCGTVMPSEKGNILELNQYMKSGKTPYYIFAGIELLTKKVGRCTNNSEKSSTIKIGECIPCGYSISKIWGFDQIKKNHTLYHGKAYLKKFCTRHLNLNQSC